MLFEQSHLFSILFFLLKEKSIRCDDPHYPKTTLVSIENTHNMCGGVPLPIEYVDQLGALTQENNLKLHVDGARIGNASAALGLPLSRICENVDSVSVCLSKGEICICLCIYFHACVL